MNNNDLTYTMTVEKVVAPERTVSKSGVLVTAAGKIPVDVTEQNRRQLNKINGKQKFTELTLPVDTQVAPLNRLLLRLGAFNLNQDTTFVIADANNPITIPRGTKVQMNDKSLCLTESTKVSGQTLKMHGKEVRFDNAPAIAEPHQQFYFLHVLTSANGLSDADISMVLSDTSDHNKLNEQQSAAPAGRMISAKAA